MKVTTLTPAYAPPRDVSVNEGEESDTVSDGDEQSVDWTHLTDE